MTEWFDLNDAEDRALAEFMSRVANLHIPDRGSPMATASDLYCKAALIARWEAERRALRPIDVMQPIEIAGGLFAAGLLLYWSLPHLFL
ncbi:MAG TPA: hypothetical protein VL693_10265 [Vicinamibacterales bacterium]|jgi:hypothetical protein|nr:hypothetical protein [Vicinamibacterales bacterium]